MVLPTDIQVSFITAAVFVDMGRKYIEKQKLKSPEHLKLAYAKFRNMGILYASVILAPVIATFFSAWPGWESQYWIVIAEQLKGNGLLSLLSGLYFFLLVAAGYFGAWLSFRWVVAGKAKYIRPVYITVGIITMALFLFNWPAPVKLGSIVQYKQNAYSLPWVWENIGFIIMFCMLLLYCIVPYFIVFIKYVINFNKQEQK